jgi:hypothetical protein
MYFKTAQHNDLKHLAASLLMIAACGGAEPAADTGAASNAGAATGSAAPSGTTPASQPAAGGGAKPAASGATAGAASKPPAGSAQANTGTTGATSMMMAAAAAGASASGTTPSTPSTPSSSAAGSGSAAAGSGSTTPAEPAAGSGAAPATGAGGFPRTGEEINIKAKGPYKVAMYEEGLVASEYSAAVMYYPEDAVPPFAAVALSPGFTAYGTDYEFVGDMLASHGIAVLLTTPTTTADQPPQRGTDLVAAVKHIQEENTREGSPLKGKIAVDRIGITGHSMGGGGSLFGANELGDMIRCVVPLQPWQPGGGFRMIAAPTMIIGAASDAIASVAGNASGHYASIPDTTEKILVVFQGDHYLSTDRTSGIAASEMAVANENYDPQAAYMIPFYKLHLEDDERYRPYLYGSERSMDLVTDFTANMM